jgi:hypothetical protein
MAASADIRVSPFARECQISHLMGRVLRHVFEPTSDIIFHNQEYIQLENTLKAFFSLLMQEQNAYADYCAALSMCSWYISPNAFIIVLSSNLNSATFLLYDSELLLNQHNEDTVNSILRSMDVTANQLVEIASLLFTPIESTNMDRLSPLVFYSIYQATSVHLRNWKLTKNKVHEENVNTLRALLGHINTRWRAAGNTLSFQYVKSKMR